MRDCDDDPSRPTWAEAERDEQGRPPFVPTQQELDRYRRTDPWNPENQRKS